MTLARYVVLRPEDGYRWQLFWVDRRLLAVSATAYRTLDECRDAIKEIRDCCATAIDIDPISDAA